MSTALYRRYRPEAFADVIGQEHVTEPMMQALRSNRVNHAYLFSGPRGCGKTTSARILARILNCAAYHPDEAGAWPDAPCGVCDSCVELSRRGSGSLDVVEIDAASHGGVDDARELRERATFAPARDRFKIFVIDEAHMVSPQGFNALLKIVEEPPEHVRFIFATTEPDKVLATIRSRTHHYPFHLVPPERLLQYLEELCAKEGVPVGKGVLPLVVRAGAGSVRDSLSVLDQLMAGAGPEGVDYERAVALLGYTHASLLDDVVEALAAGDGASVFRLVDRVIESGHDPKRFVEDLLERLRDLIVLRAVRPEGARAVLRGLPEDQLSRMLGQADRYGAGELSRAADIANAALTEMTGATSPRLHLELLCARLLLPGADVTERGLTARVDRLERRFGVAGSPAAARGAGTATPAAEEPTPAPRSAAYAADSPSAGRSTASASTASAAASRSAERVSVAASGAPTVASTDTEPPPAAAGPARSQSGAGSDELDAVRRIWPDVLERLKALKRTTWSAMSHANVLSVADGVLTVGFTNSGALGMFLKGAHADFVRQALIDVLGMDLKVEVTTAGEAEGAQPERQPEPAAEPAAEAPPQPAPGAVGADSVRAAARRNGQRNGEHNGPANGPADGNEDEQPPSGPVVVAPEHDEPEADDPDAEDSGLVGPSVVEQMLGGRVIQVDD